MLSNKKPIVITKITVTDGICSYSYSYRPNSSPDSGKSGGGMSGGAIAGIVIAALIVMGNVIAIGVCVRRRNTVTVIRAY